MATTFRIHEDIENVIEQKKERKNVIAKTNANGKEKRPTFAILNNGAFDNGRNGAHAQRTVSSYLNEKPHNPTCTSWVQASSNMSHGNHVFSWTHFRFTWLFECAHECIPTSVLICVFFRQNSFRLWIFWRPKNRPSFSRQMTKMRCRHSMRPPLNTNRKYQSINSKRLAYLKKSSHQPTRTFHRKRTVPLAMKSIVRLWRPVTQPWGNYQPWENIPLCALCLPFFSPSRSLSTTSLSCVLHLKSPRAVFFSFGISR